MSSILKVTILKVLKVFRSCVVKLLLVMGLLSASTLIFAGEPVVLVFIIDGLQSDAAEVAAANGAKNLKFLIENGVIVREAYCTSPAPRMYLPDGSLPWGTSSSPNVAIHTGTHVFESREMDDIFLSARRVPRLNQFLPAVQVIMRNLLRLISVLPVHIQIPQ